MTQSVLLSKNNSNKTIKTKIKTIKFIDLFAGIGGIRLGFENAFQEFGFNTDCVFSSEIKPYAIDAYKSNFKEETVNGDITKIKSSQIPDFDFLLAGFPCQPFSFAGKGLGFADTRGTLFFEIERIIKDKKPMGFLLENVEGLASHDGGNTLATIMKHLEELGYCATWTILDSKNFGVAQSRKRVYIVGTRKTFISLDGFEQKIATLGDILEKGLPTIDSKFTKCLLKHYKPEQLAGKAIKDKRGGNSNIHSWDIELKGSTTILQRKLLNLMLKERRKKKWAEIIGIEWMDGMPLTIDQIKTFFDVPNLQEMLDDLTIKGYLTFEHPRQRINNARIPDESKPKGFNIVAGKLSFEFTKILNPAEITPTLVAMDVSHLGIVDNGGIRRLTIKEGQKLCGFPESYNLSSLKTSEAFDLLGNTVCIPVIEAISKKIAKSVKEGF